MIMRTSYPPPTLNDFLHPLGTSRNLWSESLALPTVVVPQLRLSLDSTECRIIEGAAASSVCFSSSPGAAEDNPNVLFSCDSRRRIDRGTEMLPARARA